MFVGRRELAFSLFIRPHPGQTAKDLWPVQQT
jgi:hypothetical protein